MSYIKIDHQEECQTEACNLTGENSNSRIVTISQRVAYLKLLLSKNLTFNFSIEFFEGSLDTKEAMLGVILKLIIRKNVKHKLEI